MSIDISALSLAELRQLQSDLDFAIRTAEKKERDNALKAAEEAAAQFGFSLAELTGSQNQKSNSRAKPAAKYRNPDDHEQTWSGRGRKPQWLHEALTRGVDISELEV